MKPKPDTSTAVPGAFSMNWPREAGLADQFLAQIETKLRHRKRRRKRVATASTLAALGLGIAAWLVPFVRETDTVATFSAQRWTLALADGSSADLNARTKVRTDFRYGRRRVHLEKGEAFFSVAKDAAHPFIVETPSGNIRVTGTKFNVRLASPGRVEVTLLEGSVSVETPAAAAVHLTPGQQLDFGGAKSAPHTIDPGALENVTAWRQGRIVLDGLTLADAAARLAEFHGVAIRVAPAIAQLHPGGIYPLDDLQGFLKAIETALSVQVTTQADGSFAILAR